MILKVTIAYSYVWDALAMLLELHMILLASLIQEVREMYAPNILKFFHILS